MLSSMCGDILTLIKEDNTEVKYLKGSVQEDKIIVILSTTSIEEGDVLKRNILGSDELYLVLSSHYQKGMHSIPSHYTLKYKKIKTLEDRNLISRPIPHTQTINIGTINAENTQVGNSNVMTIHNNQFDSKIIELINEIKKQNFSKEDEQEYLEIVEEVKKQLQEQKPKKGIVKSLLGSLPALGNISSIISMIIATMGA